MAAHKPYFNKSGTRVPSVTTILGKFQDPGGLMHWAWSEGMAGRNFRDTSSRLASSGTIAHDMVEAYIRSGQRLKRVRDVRSKYKNGDGSKIELPVARGAFKAFSNFLNWAEERNLEKVHTELSLVSEEYQFGGRLDAFRVAEKLALLDWKTGSKCYASYLVQVAAYWLLLKENYPELGELDGGFDIVLFSRDEGDFHHHHFDELRAAEKQFLLLREAYELNKGLEKRCK